MPPGPLKLVTCKSLHFVPHGAMTESFARKGPIYYSSWVVAFLISLMLFTAQLNMPAFISWAALLLFAITTVALNCWEPWKAWDPAMENKPRSGAGLWLGAAAANFVESTMGELI